MNIYESIVLSCLYINSKIVNQRDLVQESGLSLGLINKTLQSLKEKKYITENLKITEQASFVLKNSHPEKAIILAAGYGLRMVPINRENPKALLTVNGEPLIDRLIKQLHEVGLTDITIVVGFLKEKFEYLIDLYNVSLVYNKNYSTKNNLHSLNCVSEKLANSYIIPSDLWCKRNPFSSVELYSWYMVNERADETSSVYKSKTLTLEKTKSNQPGNQMIGISYITEADSRILLENLKTLCDCPKYDNDFWETALFCKEKVPVYAKQFLSSDVVEINSFEQLRDLDSSSKELTNDAFDIICSTFNCKYDDIKNIQNLKKGMTNRSFTFSLAGSKYIMRIPGEGTNKIINRQEEASVYETIKNQNVCDELYYINPDNGFKITKFIENARVCDPFNDKDLKKCMEKLKNFHSKKLKVDHDFDIFGQIDFYESLWTVPKSIFDDYTITKQKVFSLIPFINENIEEKVLTHIDAVPDNFLISEVNGIESIQLIDWEYAGMQDPHVDIAMFCIYSMYNDIKQVNKVIDFYFDDNCANRTRIKIYCYIAACGLLWSNWCEYKQQLGVEFGEYSLRQYRFAKEYYRIAINEINKLEK